MGGFASVVSPQVDLDTIFSQSSGYRSGLRWLDCFNIGLFQRFDIPSGGRVWTKPEIVKKAEATKMLVIRADSHQSGVRFFELA